MYRSQNNNNNLDSFFSSNKSSSSFPYFGSQSNFQQPYIPQQNFQQPYIPQQNFPPPFRKEFNSREYQSNYDINSKDKSEQLKQIEKLENELKILRRNKATEIKQIQGNNNIEPLKSKYAEEYSNFIKEKEDLIRSLGDINSYLQRIIDENKDTGEELDEIIKEQQKTNELIGQLEQLISVK